MNIKRRENLNRLGYLLLILLFFVIPGASPIAIGGIYLADKLKLIKVEINYGKRLRTFIQRWR